MKFLLFLLAVVVIFFLLKKSSDTKQSPRASPRSAPGRDYDSDTGEVYDSSPDTRYSGLSDWEEDLEPLWSGNVLAEFTYQARGKKRERRKVEVHQVLEDSRGKMYLQGHCQLRDAQRTFDVNRITTKVLCGSKRYDVDDFLFDKLGI